MKLNTLIFMVIMLSLSGYGYADETPADNFDKFRQQALEAAKTPPPPPPEVRHAPRYLPPNSELIPRPTPMQPSNPGAPPSYMPAPSAPYPTMPVAPMPAEKPRLQQSQPQPQVSQPPNIWLKPNPWGNTTNNPWAPPQPTAPAPVDKTRSGANPSQPNIYLPRH